MLNRAERDRCDKGAPAGRAGRAAGASQTFVDPDYATSTCYKATNWQALGVTAGSGRHSRDFYQRHDKPKTLWCIELRKGARSLLSNSATLPKDVRGGVLTDAVKSTEASYSSCQSLMEKDKQEGAPRPLGRGRDRQPKAAPKG